MKVSMGEFEKSNISDLKAPFEKYVKQGDLFYDLGAGDGSVVEYALNFTEKAFGFELEEKLFENSKVRKRIIREDFMNCWLPPYNVLYYYLKGFDNELELAKKLVIEEFKGFLILYIRGAEGNLVPFERELKGFEQIDKFKNVRVYKRR